MPNGSQHRHVIELNASGSMTKQQTSATHVASAHEVRREKQPIAEHVGECLHVLIEIPVGKHADRRWACDQYTSRDRRRR